MNIKFAILGALAVSLLHILAVSKSRKLVTQTFNANANWTPPAGVVRLESLTGKGQDGTPSSYSGDVYQSQIISRVQPGGNGHSDQGSNYPWGALFSEVNNTQAQINGGGYGTVSPAGTTVTTYNDGSYSAFSLALSYSDAIPGTASWSSVGPWPATGTVSPTASSYVTMSWREYGVDNPATTGANTTAFGKTFPGGNGVPAVSSSYQNVPLTPGTAYPINVAQGGSVTITYYQ